MTLLERLPWLYKKKNFIFYLITYSKKIHIPHLLAAISQHVSCPTLEMSLPYRAECYRGVQDLSEKRPTLLQCSPPLGTGGFSSSEPLT